MAIPRDFIGYGSKPPKVIWPKGKRLAVTFVVAYEAGSERSVVFGDEGPETFGEFPVYGAPPKLLPQEYIARIPAHVAIVATTFFALMVVLLLIASGLYHLFGLY